IAAAAGQQAGEHRLRAALLFNLGRITSYTLAGGLVGLLGLWLQSQHMVFMLVLRGLAGLMLIMMGLYIAGWASWITRAEALGKGVWKFIQPLAQRRLGRNDPLSQFLLGALWGWLPCGLIYSTLSWVAANGDPIDGMICMFAFGLGTLPALVSATLLSTALAKILRNTKVRSFAGLILIGYGFWTWFALYQMFI
ncbi:MAG: sulfite exporter TauE/SafE family protein, partial [Oleibacter sp.]|nr:sulfite exporter TauE/SafE family protein [Thalassolituus sp.]